jgi:hypothetical protein
VRKPLFHIPGYIQDGKLDDSCGRVVMYRDCVFVAKAHVMDHNYILRACAARFGLKSSEVISNAVRLYFRNEENRIVLCGVRKIDDDTYSRNAEAYTRILEREIG